METEISDEKSYPCLICGAKSKGLHLQIYACRACAEFFRRSVQQNRVYKCIRGKQDCALVRQLKDKRICRFCRFKKCRELGMSVDKEYEEKIQNNDRAAIASPNPDEPIIHKPKPQIPDIKSDSKSGVVLRLDLTIVETAVKHILIQTGVNLITPGLNTLQRLSLGFIQLYNDEMKPKGNVILTHNFDLLALYRYQAKFMVALAKMLMYCEQFATLEFRDKFLLFKNSWRIICQLERYYSGIKYFGNDFNDFRTLHDNETAMDLSQFDQFTSIGNGQTNDEFQKAKILWALHNEKLFKLLINPIKMLNLSEFEIVYLMVQFLFDISDIEGLSDKAVLVSDFVLEQINSDMHNYYLFDNGIANYANRLVKLTKLIDASKIVYNSKRDIFLLGRVFDIFATDHTQSELYDWKTY